MKLPKQLITVTAFSKTVALMLFIALPFIGFYIGTKFNPNFQYPVSVSTSSPTLVKNTSLASNSDKLEQQSIDKKEIKPTTQPVSATLLNSNLPTNWQITRDPAGRFEVGFNPEQLSPSFENINQQFLFRFKNGTQGFAYYIDIRPYNGGSRHQFIADSVFAKNIQDIYTLKTYEKNYLINNKSGLVLYNIDGSMSTTLGMLDIDGKRAFLIDASTNDQEMMEKILGTLKVLK